MSSDPYLRAAKLSVGYGSKPVLTDLDFTLSENEVLCLIGHNGAGKSTLLRTLFGLLPPRSGDLFLRGIPISNPSPQFMSSSGIALVPEGRGVFPGLTVQEILRLGLHASGVPRDQYEELLEGVFDTLPLLRTFYFKRAGLLSGGQQQMVSIGRALISRPTCLFMDEPSIGLAPKLFHDLLTPIRERQQRTRMSIILVEQNIREAFRVCDRVYVMKSGAIIFEGQPSELSSHSRLMELY
jgi:branched-chain amino acid transport system ATP-binding protein